MIQKTSIFIFLVTLMAFKTDNNNPTENFPQHFFASPVGHPIELTGTFGELRPDHFHAGIDIRPKSNGANELILAAGEGFISRIKISSTGYGNFVVVQHPNGFSSAYGHLESLSPALADYVKSNQYAQESFEVELFPNPSDFPIQRGQAIGLMGNTGASQGTHLHFEIRMTDGDKPCDPLLFGIPVADTRAPKLYELKIYEMSDNNEIIDDEKYNLSGLKRVKQQVKVKTKRKKSKTKTIIKTIHVDTIEDDTLEIDAPKTAFSIKAFDMANWSDNTNGIHSMELYKDGNLAYGFDMKSIGFDETKAINAHIDYLEKIRHGSYFHRCFRLPGNPLSIYNRSASDGIIDLHDGVVSELIFVVKDSYNNADSIRFWVTKGNIINSKPDAPFTNYFQYNTSNQLTNNVLEAYFPKGTFYENINFNYKTSPDRSANCYSETHHLHSSATPIHGYFDLKIRPTEAIPDSLMTKAFIGFCEADGTITSYGGTWSGEYLSAKTADLGRFCVMVDNVPPTITPIRFNENMQKLERMSFRVSDNIATDRSVNGLTYRATVDGQWILMAYEKKSKTLSYTFDERISSGSHTLEIRAKDQSGNEKIWTNNFIR